ncbi:MAG: hypothetical protein IJ097_01120 [Bacilli bacterium]|nr:hypothetical protein [Bacilli bacterium]
MKIEKINATDYKIYFYKTKLLKDNLIDDIKDIIKKLQKRLKLKGFYRVIVLYKNIGLFFQLIRLEDSFYKNTLDLKIEIRDNDDVYFKTKDYFLIKDFAQVKYFDGYYYCLVDECFDEILEKVEFGDFIFGYDIYDVIDKAYVI